MANLEAMSSLVLQALKIELILYIPKTTKPFVVDKLKVKICLYHKMIFYRCEPFVTILKSTELNKMFNIRHWRRLW